MTDQEIAGLGPAFAGYLGRYRECFGQARVATRFDNYCRGLLSDLPRKKVEPIALACAESHQVGDDTLRDRLKALASLLPVGTEGGGVSLHEDR